MCSDCDDWKLRGLAKRDFQHSKDGPEIIEGRPKSKSKNKQWCKGKEGRKHKFEPVVWYTYRFRNEDGTERLEHRYRNTCKLCGMIEWNYKPPIPKHDHHFCITKINERWWKNAQEIYEQCCVCGGKGRSYKFYE